MSAPNINAQEGPGAIRHGRQIHPRSIVRTNILKITVICLIALVAGLIVTLPWIVYSHSLSLVDGRPTPSGRKLSADELNRVWNENEKTLEIEHLDQISPYWFYKFILLASANDRLGIEISENRMNEGMSQMAGFLSIRYLRKGNFKGKRMLWWHIANVSLSIWLQKNWSPEQITASYIAYKNEPNTKDMVKIPPHPLAGRWAS